MKTKFIALAATLAFIAPAHADHGDKQKEHAEKRQDHSGHSAADHAKTLSGPTKAVEAFSAALAAKDEKLVRALLAPDVVIAESGGAERSLAEYAASHMGADMLFMSGVKSTLKKREEFLSGDMAVVVSESEVKGEYVTKPVNARMMETMVLAREAGKWRIKHIHWSSKDIAPAAKPAAK